MKRFWISIAAAAMSWPVAAQDLALDDVERWLSGYQEAWETRDPAAAARLFTADARYFETPWSLPFDGRSAIADYWASVTADQRDVEFEFEIVAVNAATAVARWSAGFELASTGTAIALDGVFILEFETAETVGELREWWVLKP